MMHKLSITIVQQVYTAVHQEDMYMYSLHKLRAAQEIAMSIQVVIYHSARTYINLVVF